MPVFTISLPPAESKTVQKRVASGEFTAPDKYLSELVRRDEQRRKQRSFEQRLLDRLDRTGAVDMDSADFEKIRKALLRPVRGKRA